MHEAPVDSALLGEVRRRHTDRRSFRSTPLPDSLIADVQALAAPLAVDVVPLTSRSDRYTVARLNHRGHQARAVMHRGTHDVAEGVHWTSYPDSGMPGASLGMAPATLPAIRWLVKHPSVWSGFSRWVPGSNFFGTIDPSLVPGVRCAAHLMYSLPVGTSRTTAALVRGGVAVQRTWLLLSASGVAAQPNQAPLIFAWASHNQTASASDRHAGSAFAAIGSRATNLWERTGTESSRIFFHVRVGFPRAPLHCRSLRLPLDALWLSN
jgi:hypothetical protein